jgi:uncharacterized protein (TIGR02186 family)
LRPSRARRPCPKATRWSDRDTVEGPPARSPCASKARRYGIWVNVEAVEIDRAPSFYAIATTGPLEEILSETDNLRHRISIGQAVRAIGASGQADDHPAFSEALIRLRRNNGAYLVQDGGVTLDRDTLIRADVRLPANLTEGQFRTRIFLLRDGQVVGHEATVIEVQKAGIERFLHRLALDQPLIYGILSLSLAILAGWMASAAFTWIRR